MKSVRKKIDLYRRELAASDENYKTLKQQIGKVKQAERRFLLASSATLQELPPSRLPAALERVRLQSMTSGNSRRCWRVAVESKFSCRNSIQGCSRRTTRFWENSERHARNSLLTPTFARS